MANQYINVYHSGKVLSQGDGSSPLEIGPLNATENEISKATAIEIKTEAGYATFGDTTISFEGATASKWSICATETGTYTNTLTVSEVINTVGVTVYVKALATEDEAPSNDVSTDIRLETVIQAAV